MVKTKIDLVEIDNSRFHDAVDLYFLWKELDTRIKSSYTRGVNFPDAISETLCCYVTGFLLNKASEGDAVDRKNNRIIEIKATSNYDRDTTSFSPNEKFDDLFFVRLDRKNDILYFYDTGLNSENLKVIKVNRNQTLKDQQEQGRRPRFSIIKLIIEPMNIKPIIELNLRTKNINNL